MPLAQTTINISPWKRIFVANSTDTGAITTAPAVLTEEPVPSSTNGIIEAVAASTIRFAAVTTDANNETLNFQIFGLSQDSPHSRWQHTLILDMSSTAGNIATGATTEFFADVYTRNAGITSFDSSNNAADFQNWIEFSVSGDQWLLFRGDVNTAASFNFLYRWI